MITLATSVGRLMAGAGYHLPKPGDGVRVELRVHANDRDALDHCLRDQHAIEGVFMMERQGDERCSVQGIDREDLETVVEDSLLDEFLIRDMQGVLLDA
jgi:hypothetical protein